METRDGEVAAENLLQKRQRITKCLADRPYDLMLYIERATVHSDLGYPDLAAGDAYRALLLADESSDESFEYHEQAVDSLSAHTLEDLDNIRALGGSTGTTETALIESEDAQELTRELAKRASVRSYQILAISLLLCGCLKSAYEFCHRGLDLAPNDEELQQTGEYIDTVAKRRLRTDEFDIADLPDQGLVRREVYPWNDHEPDRFSKETLDFLNAELSAVSSKCVVQIAELPTLLESASNTDSYDNIPTIKQLGLFAAEDIEAGETVLDEYSILTANNRLKENLCDACSSVLPPLSSTDNGIVSCEECYDIMFCNEYCYEQAQAYHPAVCDTPNALYLLLLSRSIAMAATQDVHPLDLKQIKYIWGDFLPSPTNAVPVSPNAGPPPVWTLPFSFASNIASPLHILEKMDIDIWAEAERYDLWIINTLYAKFRGTASARQGTGGRLGPEVAAVHPLWCLANHDCDPNVQWEWGGHMRLWAREKMICAEDGSVGTGGRKGGIKKGEEVLNHYCDIELPVKDRREWAAGSLGGWCMCPRCRRETLAEEKATPDPEVATPGA
jgi:hypothetical protein